MSRLHTDPVDVHRRDDEPDQFLWRGRLYVVREVLARWTEAGCWWQAAGVSALATGDASSPGQGPAPLTTAPVPASPKWAQRAWGEPAPDVGAAVGPAGVDDGERDWWRVEAARVPRRHQGSTTCASTGPVAAGRSPGSWTEP